MRKRRNLGSRKKNTDFQTKKLKAGKTKTPSNATDTTLNVKNVQIVQHLKQKSANGEEDTRNENFTLPQVISQAKHHAPKLRKDALNILKSMIEAEVGSDFFKYNPMQILQLLGQTFTDTDYEVRQACLKTFEYFYKFIEKQQHDDFHSQVIAYTNCALTHPEPGIQMTGLKIISVVILNTPLSPKLVNLLKTCLDVSCSSGVLKGSDAAISFVEKIGKFSRQLEYKKNNREKEQSQSFMDAAELLFSNYSRPDSRKSLESEFLTEEFYLKMMKAVLSLWPLEVSRFELDKQKAEVVLKLVKTMNSIIKNLAKDVPEKIKYLDKIKNLFPIKAKKSSETVCKINFYIGSGKIKNL